jgi:hypothetical protein
MRSNIAGRFLGSINTWDAAYCPGSADLPVRRRFYASEARGR